MELGVVMLQKTTVVYVLKVHPVMYLTVIKIYAVYVLVIILLIQALVIVPAFQRH